MHQLIYSSVSSINEHSIFSYLSPKMMNFPIRYAFQNMGKSSKGISNKDEFRVHCIPRSYRSTFDTRYLPKSGKLVDVQR